MFSKLFKRRLEIPATWDFKTDHNAKLVGSFVDQVRNQLLDSFPDGVFEYADSFVEFYVRKGEALFRFRFQIRRWSGEAISIQNLAIWLAFDRLEARAGEIPANEDRYYRMNFRLDDIIAFTSLHEYKFHPFDILKEGDFSRLFNEIGFIWHQGCVEIMNQIHSVETVLQYCDRLKSERKLCGFSDVKSLAYLHCQCLMILNEDWLQVFSFYRSTLSDEQNAWLQEGIDDLLLRYQAVD